MDGNSSLPISKQRLLDSCCTCDFYVRFDARSGYWSFDSKTVIHQWKRSRICQSNGPFRMSRQDRCITYAEELASGMNQSWYYETRVQGNEELTPNALVKRWFLLPSEAFREL